MKKLSFSLLALLGIFATVFISCDEDDDGIDILPPTIEAPDEPIIDVGETVNLSFSITTPGGFQSASIASSDQSIATATIDSQPTPGPSSSGTIEVAVTGVAPGEATLTLTVTDREAQNANETLVVHVEAADAGPDIAVADTIANIENLSTLATALEATDLDETLNQGGPYTVFAPNNDAFQALLDALELNDLPAVIAALGDEAIIQTLQAHVVQDSLPSDLIQAQDYTTINDSTITITTEGDNVYVNGAQVVTADIIAGNGVVHIIDSVINIPPVENGDGGLANAGSALDTIEDLSSLNAAVDAAGLTDDLDNAEQVTIFAPNNDAIQALLDDQGVTDLDGLIAALTEEGVAGVLQAHVIADSLGAAEVAAAAGGDSLATLNAEEMIGVTTDDAGNVYVNGAQVVEADILVGNGVIHIIDSVINLPEGIEGGMANAGSALDTIEDLSTLNAAVDTTELTDDLDDAAQVTIFAPNNAAFQALLDAQGVDDLDALIDALTLEGLSNVLQAHVVADSLGAIEVVAAAGADSLQTLNTNEKLGITTEGDVVYVNGAQVLETDILVGNGVIHVIDSVVNLP